MTNINTELRIGDNESPLQASKWLKIQALLDVEEMKRLFESLGTFSFYFNGAICKGNQTVLSKELFLCHYQNYVLKLKNGEETAPSEFRPWFSLMMSRSSDALFAVPISENECLVRCSKPTILIQAHQFTYSAEDKKFRSMIFGTESISWGLQFSYPQIYQDPLTNEIEKVKSQGGNTELFHTLQRWIRSNTIPTPFYVEETRHNVPIRLGKLCLPWINRHPQLIKKGIKVFFST